MYQIGVGCVLAGCVMYWLGVPYSSKEDTRRDVPDGCELNQFLCKLQDEYLPIYQMGV